MQQRTEGSAIGALALLALALLACSTRVDQVVTRYRLDLTSPHAAEGARCWDSCIKDPNPSFRSACLRSCPGVQAEGGEGCETDGRKPVTELCHTHVFATRTPTDESVHSYGQVAAGLAETSVHVGTALVATKTMAESSESSSGDSDDLTSNARSSPARKPAEPSLAGKREHRPANVRPPHQPAK